MSSTTSDMNHRRVCASLFPVCCSRYLTGVRCDMCENSKSLWQEDAVGRMQGVKKRSRGGKEQRSQGGKELRRQGVEHQSLWQEEAVGRRQGVEKRSRGGKEAHEHEHVHCLSYMTVRTWHT